MTVVKFHDYSMTFQVFHDCYEKCKRNLTYREQTLDYSTTETLTAPLQIWLMLFHVVKKVYETLHGSLYIRQNRYTLVDSEGIK